MTRAGTVRVGDRVRFDGQVWDVGGLDAGTVYLTAQGRKPMAVTLSALFADATFEGQTGRHARGALPPTALFNELPPDVQERARWWEEHLTEVIDGVPCTAPVAALPRPEFDVTTTTLRQREQAKVDELTAQGEQVNLRALQRRRTAYETDGLLGLVDRRTVRATSVAGRTDPRVVEALQRVLERNKQRSSGTSDRLWRELVRELEAQHGPGEVALPSRATFHRLLKRMAEARHATGSARTRRTLAQQPDGPFGGGFPVRPGELMQIDSTPLDVVEDDRLGHDHRLRCGAFEAVVDRAHRLVGEYVAGYLGSSVERRGKNAEQEAVFSLVELQDLLDEWIVTGWQNRPHDGLRDPLSPGQVLTPNEKYAAMLGVAGYVPVPLSGDDYIELLPMKPRAINSYGVKINHRIYDAEELNPYRGQPSGAVGMKDLWEVHHDPYDVTRVWVRNHHKPDDGWITLWWRRLASAPVPFGEDAWTHARKVIAERGHGSPSENEIARLVDDLLRRAAGDTPDSSSTDGKKRSSARDRRVAAKTATNNSVTTPVPQTPPPGEGDPEPEVTDELNDAAPAEEEHLAEVIPLGVYDPHQEAQRWW